MAIDISKVVASKGEAAGKISGYNHMILFVQDLTKAIEFYRDILGLKIIKALPAATLGDEAPIGRNYFFQMADGSMIGLAEYKSAAPPSRSIFSSSPIDATVKSLWPGEQKPLQSPQKVDHVAFNVESRDELAFFRDRLRDHGVVVSDIIDFVERNGAQFVMSIYFFDPFGNPLEISTFDHNDPNVEERLRRDLWFADLEPPDALFN